MCVGGGYELKLYIYILLPINIHSFNSTIFPLLCGLFRGVPSDFLGAEGGGRGGTGGGGGGVERLEGGGGVGEALNVKCANKICPLPLN